MLCYNFTKLKLACLEINYLIKFCHMLRIKLPSRQVYRAFIAVVHCKVTNGCLKDKHFFFIMPPATIGRGAYCFTPLRASVRSSHLVCIVCPANSSYSFWARPFIFCRQLVPTLKVCIFYGFWLSTIFYKIMDAWT